jgi:quercetin dioxygenase-like cupin family protein
MPIEVRRFGVGHRRPDGPPGTVGVEGQVIHSDARGLVSEVALRRGGRIEPHGNPNTTWFIVIEGGGWVAVGDERRRVAAGEAVVWPAGVTHGAWTDHLPMRAIVVEFSGPDDAWARGILEGSTRRALPGADRPARGDGGLADRAGGTTRGPEAEGEPA